MKKRLLAGATCAASLASMAQADPAPREFKVIGTWGNLASWQNFEQPFWEEDLPAMSGGALTGNATPITEAGLDGTEVMRLLDLGVFEVAHGFGSYVAADDPAIEGPDLSSIANDFETMRAVAEAYQPVMDENFRETYGATVLALHPWPASMIFCAQPITSLADLEGRRVRVHSATLGDFVEGAGGVTVTLPFAEVVPALERGVADCAITDSMSAYKAKWHEVVTHVFPLPVGYSITFTAMNTQVWDSLDAETQDVMTKAFAALEEKAWADAAEQEGIALACLTGDGECPLGEPGNIVLSEPGDADMAKRQEILDGYVLKRWAERCGAECAETWNATAGTAAGLTAPTN